MKARINRLPLLLTLAVLCQPVLPSLAQVSIVETCEAAGQAGAEYGNNCECALTTIKNEVSGEQFDLYADVGIRYFKNISDGLGRADAWDAAAKSAGEGRGMTLVDVLEVTNPIGRLHAQAIKDCAG